MRPTLALTSSTLLTAAYANPLQSLFNRQATTATTLAPGLTTDQETCYADCGYCAQGPQLQPSPTYCTNQTWLGLLAGCQSCASTQNIWQIYGMQIQNAASSCNISISLAASSSVPAATTAFSSGASSSAGSSDPTMVITAGVSVISTGGMVATTSAGTTTSTSTSTVVGTSTKASGAEGTRMMGCGGVAALAAAVGGLML